MKNTKNIKSNTKRIIAIALVLVLIVSAFTACGNNADADKSTTTNSSTANAGTTDVGTTDVGNENDVPSIEDDAETTTANAGDKTNSTSSDRNSSADKTNPSSAKPNKPESKPVTTTRPSGKPASKPVETTTKPAQKPVETTTKPSSSGTNPTGNTYAYFRASTGEKIKYCTYSTLDDSRCTGISESNGKVTAKYDNGTSNEWWKCDNCGKYLCEGCEEWEVGVCSVCGRKDCIRYSHDVTCYLCGKSVKANTCHHCPNKE